MRELEGDNPNQDEVPDSVFGAGEDQARLDEPENGDEAVFGAEGTAPASSEEESDADG